MTDLTFDTSGAVEIGQPYEPGYRFREWSDLSPFMQGYVRAAFEELALTAHRTRPKCNLNDAQIWLLKCGHGGFSPVNLHVPSRGHGSTATAHTMAGLKRRGWLSESRNGIVSTTEAGHEALRTAMPLGFSDLAPATLAAMMADCEAMQSALLIGTNEAAGHEAWEARQSGWTTWGTTPRAHWPPLALTIHDDGLVYQEARS